MHIGTLGGLVELPTNLMSQLDSWVENCPCPENKPSYITAAARIKTFINEQTILFEGDIDSNFTVGTSNGFLDLSHLDLENLPDIFDIETLKRSCTTLNLTGNKLDHLPETICALTNLLSLTLDENKIIELPGKLGNLEKLRALYIDSNRLKEIPESIGQLESLQYFYAEHNQIATLPSSLGLLKNLRYLGLGRNEIQHLPDSIGNLKNLKYLQLNMNKISQLPERICELTELEHLSVSRNNLIELPNETGKLPLLSFIDIQHNYQLHALPISLGNCQLLQIFDISGTKITSTQLNALMDMCKNKELESLEARLVKWKALSKSSVDLSFLFRPPFTQKLLQQINLWLVKLEEAADYGNVRKKLSILICSLLETLEKNSEFREHFFLLLEENLTACGDRAAMLLNLLYTNWKLCTMPVTATTKEKLELLVGVAKTQTLRNVIQEIIIFLETLSQETLEPIRIVETVEVYLYFEIHFKESLSLVTAVDTMHYGYVVDINKFNEAEILTRVKGEYGCEFNDIPYIDTLVKINIPALESVLEKVKGYSTEKEKVMEYFDKALEKIDADDYFFESEYLAAMNKLKSEREDKLAGLRKEFVQKLL